MSARIARAVFEQNAEAIYYAMLRALLKGSVRVFKVLAERGYGKVRETVQVDASQDFVDRLLAGRQRAALGRQEGKTSFPPADESLGTVE